MMKYYIKRKYDKSNNIILDIDGDNIIENKYDINGNCIYSKEWNIKTEDIEYERINEYDENNRLIHGKDIKNIEYWNSYDENGNLISSSAGEGYETKYEYDDRNNVIHQIDINDYEIEEFNYINIYNKEDFNINIEDENTIIHIYDKNNNLLKSIEIDYEESYEYDNNNNCIHYKNSDGYEYWKKYDNNGNEIYYKDSTEYQCWFSYNENGDELYCKELGEYEAETFYEYYYND